MKLSKCIFSFLVSFLIIVPTSFSNGDDSSLPESKILENNPCYNLIQENFTENLILLLNPGSEVKMYLSNGSDWVIRYRFVYERNKGGWFTVNQGKTSSNRTERYYSDTGRLKGVQFQWKDGFEWKNYGGFAYITGTGDYWKYSALGRVFPYQALTIK